ncbi:MAG: phosphatase PAP2 family protein [Actinomycetota bacterium]
MLSGLVATGPDQSIVRSLNRWFAASSGRTDLAKALTVIPLYVVIAIVVLAWLFDWGGGADRRAFLVLGVGGAALALLGNHFLADVYHRPRPFVAMPEVRLLIAHSKETSMYSDHLAVAGGLCAGLFATRRWRLAAIAVLAALAVAIGRVGAGLHYPSDVAAGFAAGAVGFLVLVPARGVVAAIIRPIGRLEARLIDGRS